MTKVVNVKVSFIRPKYNNLREWCKDKNNYYIGRKGIVFIDGERYPKKDSPFANIYKVGKDGDRDKVLSLYKKYIKKRLRKEPELRDLLISLKGKKLGCWCKPEKCHGDILKKLIREME